VFLSTYLPLKHFLLQHTQAWTKLSKTLNCIKWYQSKYHGITPEKKNTVHAFRSRHPLTAAVDKWSYMSEETLSLWPRQAYGSSSCPPSATSLSHDTTGLRTVWHLEETTRSSVKMLIGACHYERRALSFWCLECCGASVSMDGTRPRRRSNVDWERDIISNANANQKSQQ